MITEKELITAVAPLVALLRLKGGLYDKVIVTSDDAELTVGKIGLGFHKDKPEGIPVLQLVKDPE